MTQPRFVLPGLPVMITCRVLRRTHLFRPDETMTQAYAYLLAWAASKHGVKVVAAVLMSTHEHLVVLAPSGAAQAAFIRDLHRMVALATKAYRRWEGAVWDHEKTNIVQLRTPQALVEKLAYLMANPVAAGCVHKAALWPGLTTRPVRAVSPFRRARSFEETRGRNPTFAVGRAQVGAFMAAVAELRVFREAYRAALELWRAGVRDVVFPEGTLAMAVLHNARVAGSTG